MSAGYRWRVGDIFVNGEHRWRVDYLVGEERAVLRSCSSHWATTAALTVNEWLDGREHWTLEEAKLV